MTWEMLYGMVEEAESKVEEQDRVVSNQQENELG